MPNQQITLRALPGIPMIEAGHDLAGIIIRAIESDPAGPLAEGDILVVSSKVVSKAEGRYVDLRSLAPSPQAEEIAAHVRKDARVVELVLGESTGISRMAPNVLIVRHRLGFTSANAGIDASNVGRDSNWVLLLPENPNASAAALRGALQAHFGLRLGVVISDTHGRPFRFGNVNVAIGAAGPPALIDQRGEPDLFGYILQATFTPLADELAAAAGLISGQADEGQPVVIIRGVAWEESPQTAQDLIRPASHDLYK